MATPVVVFVAVALYISVGFLEQSALPAFLAHVELVAHPNATKDELSVAVTSHMAVCATSLGVLAVGVAGWSGRLSDLFGRRTMAFAPAAGQAVGMILVAAAAYLEADWKYIAAAWAAQGLCGGPFVFLSAAFAYIADSGKASQRGRAFSALDSLLLYVACVGPLVGSLVVSKVGFSGAFALCATVYLAAAVTFLLAPPSPKPPAKPSTACRAWLRTSTPALLWKTLWIPKLNGLCIAFVIAVGGLNGGAISMVYYGQRYLNWGQQEIGYYMVAFSATGATYILGLHPALSWLLGRRISDLAMVRCAYFGPVLYFVVLALAASGVLPRPDILAYAAMPLLSLGSLALPHFRALFSIAQPDYAQGEQLAFVAALESTPLLYAAPIASAAFQACLHHPSVVLLGCTVLPIVAILLLWLVVRPFPEQTTLLDAGTDTSDHAPALLINEHGGAEPLPPPTTTSSRRANAP